MSGFSGTDLSGQLNSTGKRFAIVASRFNDFIVDRLLEGALDAIARTGGDAKDVVVLRCPGAWELPQVAAQLLDKNFDAIIALGCVIRGATAHFDFVAGQAASGLGALAQRSRVPILFGVLTTETIEQAVERAGTKAGNKGFEVALAAIEMVSVFDQISKLGWNMPPIALTPSARAVALQMLYALDGGADYSLDMALPLLRSVLLSEGDEPLASLDDFDDAVPLVRQIVEARPTLDETIRRHSKSWRLERMAQLDRNLLRLMLFLGQSTQSMPGAAQVTIEEAGELAKSFGTAESVAFVTGLLERCLGK